MAAHLIFSSLCEKSAISLTECEDTQGKIAMDGDFRIQTAWMPSWIRPDRPEIPIYILLVKSDFERRLEKIRCAAICAEPSALQTALLYLQAELLLKPSMCQNKLYGTIRVMKKTKTILKQLALIERIDK